MRGGRERSGRSTGLPALLGADDDPSGFVAHHPQVADGMRRHRHWRIGGTGLVMESLVPSILEQKVTGKQAFGSFRELVRRHGEPAPGPVAALRLMLQPTPATIAAIPSWEWLRLGVQPAQSRTLVTACRLASSLERVSQVSAEEADTRLRYGPRDRRVDQRRGADAGPRRRRRGQLRRLPPRQLGRLGAVGHDITDDEMAELLEPYRPQRGRAAAMAIAGGQSRPRRGPRMSIPTHLPTR